MVESTSTDNRYIESVEISKEPMILAIVQNDVDYELEGKILLIESGNETISLPLNLLGRYFHNIDTAQELTERGSHSLARGYSQSAGKRRAEILEKISEEVLIKVTECKKMAFLVDSRGGLERGENALVELAKLVHRNSGNVEGFIGNRASSCAANLLAVMDRRTALSESNFMWHISKFIDRDSIMDERGKTEQATEDTVEIRQFFENNVRHHQEEMRQHLEEIFANTSNPDNEVRFTGRALEKFGIIETVETTNDLEKLIMLRIPEIETISGEAWKRIRGFFIANTIEEELRKKFGVSSHLYVDSERVKDFDLDENISDERRSEIHSYMKKRLVLARILGK